MKRKYESHYPYVSTFLAEQVTNTNQVVDNTNTLTTGPLIEHGFFGSVYNGVLRGKSIAFKIISKKNDPEKCEHFEQECKIQARINSPYIIKYHGVWLRDNHPYAIAMELAIGTLEDKLFNNTQSISMEVKRQYITDICLGLCYLHGVNIAHLDLTCANILLVAEKKVKLADFGHAQDLSQLKKLPYLGNVFYLAPELLLLKQEPTKACDIFSLAMVIYEILARLHPYPVNDDITDIRTKLEKKQRPTVPTGQPTQFTNFITKAWDDDPSVRPTIEQAPVMMSL